MKKQNSKLKNTKLFLLLSQFSEKEHKKLIQFLESPYFNTRKEVVDLYRFWLEQRHLKKGDTKKKDLHQQLFPQKPYKDEQLRLVMSQLVGLLEQFIIIEEQQKSRIKQRTLLSRFYRKKKLSKQFEQIYKSSWQQLEKQTFRSSNYYLERYQLQLENYKYASSAERTSPQNLQDVSDSLDTAFIILKLKTACLAISHQAVFQQTYQFGLLPPILKYIDENQLIELPAIGVYYHTYFALKGVSTAHHFQEFKKILFQYTTLFPKEELVDLYLLGINCGIQMINKGNTNFIPEVLALYKQGLSTNALLINGTLSRFTFQNIVSVGLRTKEYAWTRAFLQEYKNKVDKAYRKSAYRFNLGRIAYSEQKYDEALQLLRDTDHKDLLINLFSKTLLLKIYYELSEFKLLDSFLEAFKIYLQRKKVIGYHKENYQKIIYYTQQLMKLNPYDKSAKKKLQERIEGEEQLLEKKWLLERLEAH